VVVPCRMVAVADGEVRPLSNKSGT